MTLTAPAMTAAHATLLSIVLPEAAQQMISKGMHPSLVLELFQGEVDSRKIRERLFEAFVAAHGQVSREAALAKGDHIMAVFDAHGEDRESLVRHVGYSPHKLGPIPNQVALRVSGMTPDEVHSTEWDHDKSFHRAYYMMGILFALGTWWICERLQVKNPNVRRPDLPGNHESFAGAAIAAEILGEIINGLTFEAAHPELHPGLAWELFA